MSEPLSFEEWLDANHKDKIEKAKSQHGYLIDDECVRDTFYPMYEKYLSENKSTKDLLNEVDTLINDICNKEGWKIDELKGFNLNEAAIEKWFADKEERKTKKTKENKFHKWLNKWFGEVKKEFNQWKQWMSLTDEAVSNTLKFNEMGFASTQNRPYMNYNLAKTVTRWDRYLKASNNHTIQGYVDFMKWVKENEGEREIPLYISPNLDSKNPPNVPCIW